MGLNEKGHRNKWEYRYKESCDGCYYDVGSACARYRKDTTGTKLDECRVMRPVKVR